MSAVNIAVLSTAHIHTKGFLENIVKAGDGRRIHAIWDDVPERGRRYAKQFGAPFVADLAQVLADPQVHGFLIAAENTRHLPLLRAALPVGKPVFCEKPLVTDGRELAEVRTLLRRHPTPLFCGYFKPFGPRMRAIAAKLRAGELGTVTHARYRNAHHAAYGRWFDNPDLNWFYQPALSGGGAFMDMGTHAIHLLRTLFGPAQRVLATIGNRSGIYPTCDDFGIAHIEFANGVLGTVEAAWIHNGGPVGLEINGSGGAVWQVGNDYVVGKPKQDPQPIAPADEAPKTVDRLVAVVRGQIPAADLAADLAACLDAVAIMEAAYASARSGAWAPVADGAAVAGG